VLVDTGSPDEFDDLEEELGDIGVKLADVNEFLTSQGNEVAASTPEQFAAYIRSELAKWGKLIKQAGLHAE